eukprot:GHVL01019767.1.p1 GENE.GHVL01019767.1~~GHVL01019767.1.p1  ORF type:complete len:301 (-),score=36.61 GHVL01019767.1:1509-2411(-)
MTFKIEVIAIFIINITRCLSWGKNGHSAVGFIAQTLALDLENNAITNWYQKLLHGDVYCHSNVQPDLSCVAPWADNERFDERNTSGFHFVDMPPWACKYESSYCEKNICAVSAIANFTEQLMMQRDVGEWNNTDALKFVDHIVGDIHQPLHVGFKRDFGGNSIKGHYFKRAVSLHGLWDDNIIYTRLKDFKNPEAWYSNLYHEVDTSMIKHVTENLKNLGPLKTVEIWASESSKLACTDAYMFEGVEVKNDFHYGAYYYNATLPVIENQLRVAGVRLYALLDYIVTNNKKDMVHKKHTSL